MLAIDAKATEHTLHRQGIGKLKHVDVAYLQTWNEAVSKTVIAKHCLTLGYRNMDEKVFRVDGK